MSGINEMARNLLAQEQGRVDYYANAAKAQFVPQQAPARHNGDSMGAMSAKSDANSKQQVDRLMHSHGQTVTQAQTVAALAWGDSS